jgi:hypothetical protein
MVAGGGWDGGPKRRGRWDIISCYIVYREGYYAVGVLADTHVCPSVRLSICVRVVDMRVGTRVDIQLCE